MPLIINLLVVFAVAFAGGIAYQVGLKKRPLAQALHLAAIFGMAVMLGAFLALLLGDLVIRAG